MFNQILKGADPSVYLMLYLRLAPIPLIFLLLIFLNVSYHHQPIF